MSMFEMSEEKYQKALDCARESGYPTCKINKAPSQAVCMVAIGDEQAKKQAERMEGTKICPPFCPDGWWKPNYTGPKVKLGIAPKLIIGGIILYILLKMDLK